MERRIGLSSSFARWRASGPHGYQSTGLSLCWRRYGLVCSARRFGTTFTLAMGISSLRDLRAKDGGHVTDSWNGSLRRPAGRCFQLRPAETKGNHLLRGLTATDSRPVWRRDDRRQLQREDAPRTESSPDLLLSRERRADGSARADRPFDSLSVERE